MDRAEKIEEWLQRTWKIAKESGALWLNIQGYNVAVMEEHTNPGKWKYRIKLIGSENETWSNTKYNGEEEAKLAVLETLADSLNIV